MKRFIISFDTDEHGDWRALLSCGHYQHVRHRPPLESREWVLSEETRNEKIGAELECKECELADRYGQLILDLRTARISPKAHSQCRSKDPGLQKAAPLR